MLFVQREEKFFSRLVTHVVTSRPIPAVEVAATSPTEPEPSATENGENNMQTVNPSLLEKTADAHGHASLKNENRRDQATMDVLLRARQMGMKIWALEKLQRMITTINDDGLGGQANGAAETKTTAGNPGTRPGDRELSRLLRQELLNGPSDRDPLSSMEMIMFKGPFIYIHDMNEKTKPVMVREYSRVARRQDGTWPQFRSAPLGKCPFIDEPPSRKEYDRQRLKQAQREKKKAAAAAEQSRSKTSYGAADRNIDAKVGIDQAKAMAAHDTAASKQVDVPTKIIAGEQHERKSSESFIPPHFPRTGPFYTGREPAASGMQPSNVTSAIRSQMVSSTAGVPGAKAGLSKEVHGLKRKVLEKGTGGITTHSMAAPQRPNGLAMHPKTQDSHDGTQSAPEARRPNEDRYQKSEVAGTKRRREDSEAEPKKPERRRDPKPGYCENCRDKFDDFEEHTMTRKHRRFAQNSTNWAELDALLYDIQRPRKDEYEESD